MELLDDHLNSKKSIPIVRRVLRVTKQERVNFHESVPRPEALALADALQKAGYFDGSAPCDVHLDRGDKGPVVSFVVTRGTWDKPEKVKFYRQLGGEVAGAVGGKPLTVRFIDSDLAHTRGHGRVRVPPIAPSTPCGSLRGPGWLARLDRDCVRATCQTIRRRKSGECPVPKVVRNGPWGKEQESPRRSAGRGWQNCRPPSTPTRACPLLSPKKP